jgi:hypothetical protein
MNPSGPTKTAETVVAFFVPPACREEVLGDLYERFRSPGQYWLDAIRAVPLVIASRVRRTSAPQAVATLALAVYAAFLGAAFFWDRAFLHEQWGLLRLAVPVAPVLLALMLEDAYSKLGRRPLLQSIRGAVLGLGLAWLLQLAFAFPRWLMLYGGAIGLILISALRMLLPAAAERPQGANGAALAFADSGEPVRSRQGSVFVLKVLAVVMIGVLLRAWNVDVSPRLLKPFIGVAAAALVLHELNRRA